MNRGDYRKFMRANFRGFWLGVYNYDDFVYQMQSTIRIGLRQAFEAGMKKAGIDAFAITPEERLERESQIANEINYVHGPANWLLDKTKVLGGKLAPVLTRAEKWVSKWDDVFNMAYQLGMKDQPLEWFLGATEEHCRDCSTYDGRVYRASIWFKYGIRPKSRKLACFGTHCDCDQKKTDKPLNRGRPPMPTGKG